MERDPAEDPQPGDVVKYYPQTITVIKRTTHSVHYTATPSGAFEARGMVRIGSWRQTFRWEERALREFDERAKELV